MMRWFTADTHFGHENHKGGIIKMMARMNGSRLFNSIEEHDVKLLDEINSRVNRDDELFILGDFAWDVPGRYRAKIKCKHIKFVLGNHDKVEKSRNVFGELHKSLNTEIKKGNNSIKIHLCHYPHSYWDGSHKGFGHLYGHCHGQKEEELDILFPERRAFDVGVDNVYKIWGHYGPINEHEVFDYLAKREGHDDVRFYHDYQNGLYLERGLL